MRDYSQSSQGDYFSITATFSFHSIQPHSTDTLNTMRLWRKALRQAVEDLHTEEHRDDAVRFFLCNKYCVGSFLWMCDIFNIDPQAIRRRYKSVIYSRYRSDPQYLLQ